MDDEFKGSTKQSLTDIRDDIIELKASFNAFVKNQGDRDERFENRFVRKEALELLEKRVFEHAEDIQKMKQRWWYIQGAWAVIALAIALFADQVRSFIFRQ